jgi:hypothetical protein
MKKEHYGFSNEIQIYLQDTEQSIPKGSFVIIKRSGKGYWYFNLSSGKNRLIYLCPITQKGNEENSFLHSVSILKKKLKNEHKRVRKSNFIKVIDDYIIRLRTEGDTNRKGVERTQKTIQDIISQIKKFRSYVEDNPIGISDVSREEFKDYFSNFINHLIDSGLKPNSIGISLVRVRQFLNELSNPSIGSKIIPYHPITSNFIKSQYSVKKQREEIPSFYTEERYFHLMTYLTVKIREVWREYIKNPELEVDKRYGVYFTSILQLFYGFRIGELLTTYQSDERYKTLHKSKGGYSFLKKEKEGYIFEIYWKRKYGSVFVDFEVYSWTKPPSYVPYKEFYKRENHTKPTYSTNIVDVILHLYPNGDFLFPINETTIRKYFTTDILSHPDITEIGLKGTHDLRDMMINYELHTQGTSFVDLSQITRNNVQTIENYYLHSSKELSKSKSQKLNIKNRLEVLNKVMLGNVSE